MYKNHYITLIFAAILLLPNAIFATPETDIEPVSAYNSVLVRISERAEIPVFFPKILPGTEAENAAHLVTADAQEYRMTIDQNRQGEEG